MLQEGWGFGHSWLLPLVHRGCAETSLHILSPSHFHLVWDALLPLLVKKKKKVQLHCEENILDKTGDEKRCQRASLVLIAHMTMADGRH